jgi:hypothetical protein
MADPVCRRRVPRHLRERREPPRSEMTIGADAQSGRKLIARKPPGGWTIDAKNLLCSWNLIHQVGISCGLKAEQQIDK